MRIRKLRKSALSGPLRTKGKEDWVGKKVDDPHPILYFSGIPKSASLSEKRFDEVTGARFRCISYAYCGPDSELYSGANAEALEYCIAHDKRVFLDSGAHTFQNIFYGRKKSAGVENRAQGTKRVREMVSKICVSYANFVKASNRKWKQPFDFYVNLDYQFHSPEIRRVLLSLYDLGIRPVPVYHGDKDISWLKRYIDDGHKLIGISTCNRTSGGRAKLAYYDSCFNLGAKYGVVYHGFAQTGTEMFRYPWYSVDSASWLKAASYGRIIYAVDGGQSKVFQLRSLHVSEVHQNTASSLNCMPESVQAQVRNQTEAMGFDLHDLRSSDPKIGLPARGLFNAVSFLSMADKYQVRPRAHFGFLI